MLKAFLTPRWFAWHALLLVSLIGLGRVGWWQLETARAEGDWQNYGYALQWWLFGGFAVFLWVKLVLDELDPSRLESREPTDRPPVVQRQAPAPTDEEDDELAAYNRRLARLAENDRR